MENSMEIKGRIFKNSAIWRINEGIVGYDLMEIKGK